MENDSCIELRGVRTHTLKNIAVSLPRQALVVVTGVSGSGKSSLVFDTLYAEASQRYLNGLSCFARQVVSRGVDTQVEIDYASGLSPAMALDQRSAAVHPRDTVGSVTGCVHYLRLLFSHCGTAYCPRHSDQVLEGQTREEIIRDIQSFFGEARVMVLSPIASEYLADEHTVSTYLDFLQKKGFVRIYLGDHLFLLEDRAEVLAYFTAHVPIVAYIVVDRCRVTQDHMRRLIESVDTALESGEGSVTILALDGGLSRSYQTTPACARCGYALPLMSPQHFSTSHPSGACLVCQGLGWIQEVSDATLRIFPDRLLSESAVCSEHWPEGSDRHPVVMQEILGLASDYQLSLSLPYRDWPNFFRVLLLRGTEAAQLLLPSDPVVRTHFTGLLYRYGEARERICCPECAGSGLQEAYRCVRWSGLSLLTISSMSIEDVYAHVSDRYTLYQEKKQRGLSLTVAEETTRQISGQLLTSLHFMRDMGLGYLSLHRPMASLSHGEAQRVRLSSRLGLGLSGVLYLLDEPSAGLHPRDVDRVLRSLRLLQQEGNSVIVIAHDESLMRSADYLLEMGPGAGEAGGYVTNTGTLESFMANPLSITAQYLRGTQQLSIPRRVSPQAWLSLSEVSLHTLAALEVSFPLHCMTVVSGVSGSGKSTLVCDVLYPVVRSALDRRETMSSAVSYRWREGQQACDEVVMISEGLPGRAMRSTVATYCGIFAHIRSFFADLSLSKQRGYTAAHFSFNVPGGRCEACRGEGQVKVEMLLMPSFWTPCTVCAASRYRSDMLDVRYQGHSIADVLSLSVDEACDVFRVHHTISSRLEMLSRLGLGYLRLGQTLACLSGGEAQRLKLSVELARSRGEHRLYILDEPTRGLHPADIAYLVTVLIALRDAGHTVIVIEHNLSVIGMADWVIDMGPEGGAAGGQIVATGYPEEIAAHQQSITGRYLREYWHRCGLDRRRAM